MKAGAFFLMERRVERQMERQTEKQFVGKNKPSTGSRIKKELVKNRYIYLLSIPVIVYYILFWYMPMFGIVIAFKQYNVATGILASKWVGFKYFAEFFRSSNCLRVIKNTLGISLYTLIVAFPVPIIFALMLNEIRSQRFKKTIQTVTYLPHFISMIVVCGMISDFLSTEGVLTGLFASFTGVKKNYLGEPGAFKTIYVLSGIWQSFGWSSIVYLAALSGVNAELYEAATIDGAGRFSQLWAVTIPGIAPTIITMLILEVGQMMNVGYEKIILLYSPATYETADVISSFVYRRGLGESAQYSYSAAVGLFQSVVNMILLLIVDRISLKASDTSLFN